jgi:hypothetical protein
MSDSNEVVLPCILYEEKVKHSDYDSVKVEVELLDGTYRRRTLPRFSGDKGVEGLFYVFDEFISQAAQRLNFEHADYWTYWPDVLDPVARRKWHQITDNILGRNRTLERFREEIDNFITHYSNSASPRDDLIRYLASDDCKKPRKVSPDDHATRIETLCLYANRLRGTEAPLPDNRITMIIFNSFPEPWKRDFKIGRGRPENFTRSAIMEYMNLRKSYADVDEEKHRKRKSDKGENSNANKKKTTGKPNGGNVCRHHGTHPWNECSLNPQSKNYHMNPRSPFYRGGRGGGRGDGGRGNRNYGRGRGNDFGGRGGMPPQQQYMHQGRSQGGNHQQDRGSGRGQDRGSFGNNNNNYSHNYHYGMNPNDGGADRHFEEMYNNYNTNHGRGDQW